MLETPQVLIGNPLGPTQTNCACSDGGMRPAILPLDPLDARPWQLTSNLYRLDLPDEHELFFDPQGFSNVVVLNQSARTLIDSFATPRLIDMPDIAATNASAHDLDVVQQFATLGLIHPTGRPPAPFRSEPHELTAWLHVTNACNLRCTYCYINKTNQAMNEATGRAAVEAVFRSAERHGFRAVKFKYAGGEATLNFQLMMQLHHHASALAAQTGLTLHEVVLSNGVALSRSMIEQMRDAGIRLTISLDGVGAAHDAQRVFINGRGSFAVVARGIERTVQLGLLPDLSITVTGHNAENLATAVEFALDYDLRFNLNFYRDNDCSASFTDLVADQQRMIAGIQAAFQVIEQRLPRQRLIDGLVDRSAFNQPHEYGCGAGHNYLVIDHNGGVARCQMEIERTITTVLVEDPLHAVRKDVIGFQNMPVSEKEGCRDCTWRYWCAGGCSLLTFRMTGRSDVKSPYCSVYKTLYPDLIRLEGLRLLKWAAIAA